MSTTFWLLTMAAYLHYARGPGIGKYALVVSIFLLGLASKAPQLVTLPFALLLLDFWPLQRVGTRTPDTAGVVPEQLRPALESPRYSLGRLFVEKLPLLLLAIAASLTIFLAHRGIGMARYETGLPLGARIENALVSYMRYIGKTFWPSDLSILYLHPGTWPVWQVDLALLVLGAVTLAVLYALRRRRAPYLAVGWFWFLGVLVPFSGIVQAGAQAMADRFAYVPAIGLFIMLVWGVANLTARWRWRRVALAVLGSVVVSACVGVTSRQLRHWKDSITVFTQAIAVDPKNFVAHNNLALALGMAGRWDDALSHANEALRYNPNSSESHSLAGMILDEQKKFAESLVHYEAAARLKPAWPLAHFNMAQSLTRLGKIPEAIEQYTILAEMAPNDPGTHAELGRLLASQQRIPDAIAHYRAALAAAPTFVQVLNELAWILATHPRAEFRNGAEAVQLAERACELTQRQQAAFLGTLAAAYAEVGRFPDAIQAAQQARTLALTSNQTNIATINERALKLYEARQPYRQSETAGR